MIKTKKRILLCLVMAILLLCVGCQEKEEVKGLEEGQYYTYYVNSSGTALVSRIYEPQATDTMGIIEELFTQCQIAPSGGEGRRAIPSNVVVAQPPQLEERIVNLYFDNTYTTMDQVTELLCKAAMAKTITQLETVDYIRIHINGEVYKGFNSYTPNTEGEAGLPGLGPEDGEEERLPGNNTSEQPAVIRPPEKSLWSGEDFLDNTGDDTNKYVQAELVLYYGNSEGKALLTEVREVVYSSTLSLERVVMNQLIEGPKEEGMIATLPKNLKVQGVSVRDGICYVDFDATFLEEPVNVTDQVEIYSIVNSLTELPNVLQVQLTVNGSPDVMLRNNISLASRFEKALNMIALPEVPTDETQEPSQEPDQDPTLPVETDPLLPGETETDQVVDVESTAEEPSGEENGTEVTEAETATGI